jgi:hypothetical protein
MYFVSRPSDVFAITVQVKGIWQPWREETLFDAVRRHGSCFDCDQINRQSSGPFKMYSTTTDILYYRHILYTTLDRRRRLRKCTMDMQWSLLLYKSYCQQNHFSESIYHLDYTHASKKTTGSNVAIYILYIYIYGKL